MIPDTDLTRDGAVAETDSRLRAAFATGRTRPLAWRKAQLRALCGLLSDHRQMLAAALNADLGKSAAEAHITEIGFTVNEIDHSCATWTVGSALTGSAYYCRSPRPAPAQYGNRWARC
ncbi:hypothetical protein [Streptomyces sp. UG1]|uniref:hypothetical protein n=1 Tax=Streptomyces sp. UG1 TaxID=3417652 RepID=UPI003CF80EE2